MSVFDGGGNLRQDRMPPRRDRVPAMSAYDPPDDREDLFTNRPPNADQAEVLDAVTEAMLSLDSFLHRNLPDSRFRSLALTKLEECSMWAKKAVVFTVATGDPAT